MISIVEIENLFKSFKVGVQTVDVLKGINLNVPRGDFMIITGPSGSGKSTLLHTIIGLEEPTKGSVRMLGHEVYGEKNKKARSEILTDIVGMIYQRSYWIRSLNVLENVAFPLMLHGYENDNAIEKAGKILEEIKMAEWSNYQPYDLSSGQQQKIALARALVIDPEIIIADEPTGNLDTKSGDDLLLRLQDLNTKSGKTIIMVTHNLEYLKFAKHSFVMINGQIENEIKLNASKNKKQ